MRFKFVATVICEHEADGRGCTELSKFEADPEGYSLEEFAGAAKSHFRDMG